MNESIKVNVDLGADLANGVKQAAELRRHLEAVAKIQFKGLNLANKIPGLVTGDNTGRGESKTARSIGQGAGTGSAVSDFAAQSKGLGGLVHVYATFAANVFAASAAFSALSKAADLTNMVKGLDQLGASSGRALGSLAKQLVAVTDGAISMRDSMNSVALASSGGLSNATILRMGEVARRASLALGRDMPDAMDRLTRGIIKVEPELLDELGIMARVIPAQQAYALSIGKTVSGLTELEKKQAFANAVLKEGEEKFGAIELSANNYSKILASMINIAQTALEGINKFLSPLVGLLASSPTALATAMGLVASILLKQAIPAIGYFKESTAEAAKKAEDLANRRNAAVKSSLAEELAANLAATKAKQEIAKKSMLAEIAEKKKKLDELTQDEIAKVDAAQKQIESIRDKSFKKGSRAYQIFSTVDPSTLTNKDYAFIESQAKKFDTLGKSEIAAVYRQGSQGFKEWAAAEENYINKSDQYKKEFLAHMSEQEAAYKKQEEANNKRIQQRHSNFTVEGRLQTEADRSNLASTTRTIANNAAQTASIKGFSRAVVEAHEQIKQAMAGPQLKQFTDEAGKTVETMVPAMSKMRAGWTYVTSGISAATTAISGFMSFLAPWTAFAGIVVAFGAALYSWTTKTEKESANTSAAIDGLRTSITGVDNVVTSLSKKDPLAQISTAAINAKAGAFTALAESISKVAETSQEEIKKMGLADNLLDAVKFYAGKDVFRTAVKESSKGITEALKLVGQGPEAIKAKKRLSEILGTTDISNVDKVIESLGKNNATYEAKITKVNELFAKLGLAMRDTASIALELDDAFKTTSKAYDTITTSMMPSDNLAKLGFDMQNLGQKMAIAFENPITAISELANIAGDVTKLRFFDPKISEALVKDASKIKVTAGAIKEYTDILSNLSAEEENLSKQASGSRGLRAQNLNLKKEEVSKQKLAVQDTLNTLNNTIAPYLSMLKQGQNEAFSRGATLVANSIGIESQKAAINVAKAMAEGLGSTIGGIEQKARLDSQLIDVQIRQIKTQIDLITVNEKLVALAEESNLRAQREELNKKGINTLGDVALLKELTQRIRGLEIRRENPITSTKSLVKELETAKGAKLYAAQGSIAEVEQKATAEAQINTLNGQKRAIAIAKEFAIMTELNNIAKDKVNTETSSLNLQKSILDARSSSVLYISEELAAAKNLKAEDIARQAVKISDMDLQLEYNKALKTINNTLDGTQARKEAQAALDQIMAKQKNKSNRDELEAQGRILTAEANIRAAKLATLDAAIANSKQARDIKNLPTSTDLAVQEESLAVAKAYNVVSDQDIASKTTALNLAKERLRSEEALATMQDSLIKEQIALGFKLEDKNLSDTERKAITDKMALNRSLYNEQVAGENATREAKLKNITAQGVMNELQAKHIEQMNATTLMAEDLSTAFGKVGESLGKVASAFLKAAQEQEKLNEQKANIKDEKDAEKYKKDQLKADLKGFQLQTNAVKDLFDVKSEGYKVLSGIEQATAAASAVVRAKELTETIANTAAIVSARIPSIYAAFMQMGPWGIAAASAAIAAYIGFGSKGNATYNGPSAAEIQKAQGTGQSYVDGRLINNGAGVLGDVTIKSESINKSLDLIASTSVENLTYANKMLDALTSIKNNISAAATALFKTSNIGKAGGGFGITEGVTDTTGIMGKAFQSVILNPFMSIADKLTGGLLDKVFGSSQTTYIQNQGVKFVGSFKDVLDGISGSLLEFTTTITENKDFFGTSTSAQYYTKQLDSGVTSAIQGIFKSATNLFIDQGAQLGKSAKSVMTTLSSLDISSLSSLKDLKGEELTKAFTDSINGILDKAAAKIYPELMQFQKGGEAAFETVNRVLDSSYKIKMAFESIGKSIGILGEGAMGYMVSEGLAEAAGGLDKFLEQTKQFGEDFLTDAERLAPVQRGLTARMQELGYANIDTREEFKQLILGFKLVGANSYKTYTSLLALAPAFNEVYPAAEKLREVLTSAELAGKKADLQIKILTLLGDAEGALAKTREKELEGLDERLVATQKYVYALEDEATARTKLDGILKSTITSISAAIKSIQEYKNALKIGDKSTLTPAERYASTKSTLMSLAQLANTQGGTEAEKAAQADALAKLPAASDTFLAASKEMYASSSQYSSDFTTVLNILDSTNNALNIQKSTAELQLAQLEGSAALLGVIKDNTKTTAELLQQYLSITTNVLTSQSAMIASSIVSANTPTLGSTTTANIATNSYPIVDSLRPAENVKWYANGGLASGLAVVGEQGPELVDFQTPGRVYSNRASNDMFNMNEVVAELRAVKQELATLRKEQREQTGHLINSNYDASGQVANAVNKTIDGNASNNSWLARSIPKIA